MKTTAVDPFLTNLNNVLAVLLALGHDLVDVTRAALEVIEVGMIAIFVRRDGRNLHKLFKLDTAGTVAGGGAVGLGALYGGKREAIGGGGIRAGVGIGATRGVVARRIKASEEPSRSPGEGSQSQVEEAAACGGGKEHGCCSNRC